MGMECVRFINSFRPYAEICQRDQSASVPTCWGWFFVGLLETLVSTTACKSSVLAACLGIALVEAIITLLTCQCHRDMVSCVIAKRIQKVFGKVFSHQLSSDLDIILRENHDRRWI